MIYPSADSEYGGHTTGNSVVVSGNSVKPSAASDGPSVGYAELKAVVSGTKRNVPSIQDNSTKS